MTTPPNHPNPAVAVFRAAFKAEPDHLDDDTAHDVGCDDTVDVLRLCCTIASKSTKVEDPDPSRALAAFDVARAGELPHGWRPISDGVHTGLCGGWDSALTIHPDGTVTTEGVVPASILAHALIYLAQCRIDAAKGEA